MEAARHKKTNQDLSFDIEELFQSRLDRLGNIPKANLEY